jgi:hypothetical protein
MLSNLSKPAGVLEGRMTSTLVMRNIDGATSQALFQESCYDPEVLNGVAPGERCIQSDDFGVYDLLFNMVNDRKTFYYDSTMLPMLSNLTDAEGGEGQDQLSPLENAEFTPFEALKQCHNARVGHHGARRTWEQLQKNFPGNLISYRAVQDFVAECPICQKDRLTDMKNSLTPLVRHLKRPSPKSRIGIDTLTVTPVDIHGNQYLTVIVNHFTKLVAGYPSKKHDAESTAAALYQYFSTYGLVDEIITDPGSEFMNEVISQLTNWFGITHVFSLVDRHESNGVEPTNREILRHLKALVMDERVKNKWSDPTVLPGVFWIINSQVSSESGVIPFHAHFGNQNATYHKIPEGLDDSEQTCEFVRLVSANLQLCADVSKSFQDKLVKERTKDSPPDMQNKFQTGDFVLLRMNPDQFLPNKLHPKFKGPYEVVSQYKNDVECKSLIYGSISKYHVSRLKLFHGECTPEELRERAFKLAQIDNDQYVLTTIHAYQGDIELRSTLFFEAEFFDGSKVWLPYSQDLFHTEQYELFIDRTPELLLCKYTVAVARVIAAEINASPIVEVNVGSKVFVNLRQYGSKWYEELGLEQFEYKKYMLPMEYTEWVGNQHRKIRIHCEIMDDVWNVNHLWVRQFGSVLIFDPGTMILIDEQFIFNHPEILSDRRREMILARCRNVLGL